MIENARIKSTHLGEEDHGIFTAMLTLMTGESQAQGFGGYCLDTPKKDENGTFLRRAGTAFGMEFVIQVLETLEVSSWEKLPGTYCRIDRESSSCSSGIRRIGHILKDRWFDPKELAKEYHDSK